MKIKKLLLNISITVGFACLSPFVLANSTDDRVSQLERITTAHGQLFSQIQQQLSANQQDINNLRDQMDQLQYKLQQATSKQDLLMQQFNQMVPESKADNTAVPAATTNTDSATMTNGAAVAAKPASGNDFEDYNAAVNLILTSQKYDEAIVQLQSFIANYPKSDYLANAYYWLAQSYFSTNQMDRAAENFAYVVKNYPDSAKSSDAFFKVGQILETKGDIERAKSVYAEVVKSYPGTESAKKAQEKL